MRQREYYIMYSNSYTTTINKLYVFIILICFTSNLDILLYRSNYSIPNVSCMECFIQVQYAVQNIYITCFSKKGNIE
jgi:hypothetical protein